MYSEGPDSAVRHSIGQVSEPDDFDEFWFATLRDFAPESPAFEVAQLSLPLQTMDVYDITFAGFGGEPIKAWLRVPRVKVGALPTVVEYVGANGGRGHPLDNLVFASSGLAHFQMDNRGQGGGWSSGDTSDLGETGPQAPGTLTKGIQSREPYYYRRLMVDAVCAIRVVRELAQSDQSRISVHGVSQGGGIALAVAGLVANLHKVIARIPFLCDIERASKTCDRPPYSELQQYLAIHRHDVARVGELLRYFDAVNFSRRAFAPAHFYVELMDLTCPPSTVYAAFNNYKGAKEIGVWAYNGHEGGQADDDAAALEFLMR